MYITYDKKNGKLYGKLCTSHRNGHHTSKDVIYLGLVLDQKRGIYKNKKRGIYTYDLETNSYGSAPADFVPDIKPKKKSELILDFGDVYFVDEYLKCSGLINTVDAIGYGNPDTLKAMLCYYILCSKANCHAQTWWEGSYASICYPKANLTSQRISDFLTAIGDEQTQRDFFSAYFALLGVKGVNMNNILIDSTGMPNSIHFPLTAVSNHNGKINNEVRLIYVVQQETGMPIYFRYIAGNIIDSSTLVRCIAELKEQGVNTEFAIMDAGYVTEENVLELYKNNVAFVTRLPENRTIYTELLNKAKGELESAENMVKYGDRYLYVKMEECDLYGKPAYAYIGLDILRKGDEARRAAVRASRNGTSLEEVHRELKNQGYFIIISTRKIKSSEILPLYYTRQQIEQIFDIGKNYADMMPIRVQSEEAFRGHLLLTFIATVCIKMIQDKWKAKKKKTDLNPISMFMNLRNQKCKVYDTKIITTEPTRKMNECYGTFKIECPASLPRAQ